MSIDYAGLRALVVDDNAFTRRLISEVLHNLGTDLANIAEACDGLEALQILKTQEFQIIISDWHMKPMDGLTFTRKIRDPLASPAPDTPVVLCTADPQANIVLRAMQMGVDQVITKPINIADFDKRIRQVFASNRPRIRSTRYAGPDRRMEASDPGIEERRRENDIAKP